MLDECDEMLNMGFVDDVEKILGAGGDIQAGPPFGHLAQCGHRGVDFGARFQPRLPRDHLGLMSASAGSA